MNQGMISQGNNIINKLEKLKKAMDKRTRFSLFNLFVNVDDEPELVSDPDEDAGIFDILSILFGVIAFPRKRKAKKIKKLDSSVKQEVSVYVQNLYGVLGANMQNLRFNSIQEYLQMQLKLDWSISGKKDKEYARLIKDVIQEMELNNSVIGNMR